MTKILLLALLLATTTTVLAQDVGGDKNTIRFSGYDWEIREQGKSGPGPNYWNPKNVWVDKNGYLHLRITRGNGAKKNEWHCAELNTKQKFGMGEYVFETAGRIDQLDRNVVLGLFDYPVFGEVPMLTNEIDIEFARWGNAAYPNGNFTIYPATGKRGTNDSHTFEYSLAGMPSDVVAAHRFTRSAKSVALATSVRNKTLAQWTFAPTEARFVPQKPLAIHINLWLFEGNAPTDNKPVEIIIRNFVFTPTNGSISPTAKK
ncbi:MAG: glycoside hydrolase family 16 protein [Armatimonadetes bacterium]|nr:glycoside hydrolase family 16 protein [Armatimonadota bacterium]